MCVGPKAAFDDGEMDVTVWAGERHSHLPREQKSMGCNPEILRIHHALVCRANASVHRGSLLTMRCCVPSSLLVCCAESALTALADYFFVVEAS